MRLTFSASAEDHAGAAAYLQRFRRRSCWKSRLLSAVSPQIKPEQPLTVGSKIQYFKKYLALTCTLTSKNCLPIFSPADKHTQNTTAGLPHQYTLQNESQEAPFPHSHFSTLTYTTSCFLLTQTSTSYHTPRTLLSCPNIPSMRQQQLIYNTISTNWKSD